jgi:hypothetical protein
MSRRLLLGVAVLVLGGLLPGTASAAPEAGLLVVEGRGGTTMTWVVEEAVFLGNPQPTLLGGGDYAGVLIRSLDGSPSRTTLGAVQVRAFRDSTREAVAPFGASDRIEPGRYEVVLLGQGPVRAAYQLPDRQAPGVRLVPRTRLPVSFLGRAEALPAGGTDTRVELPGTLPAGRRAIQVALRDRTSLEDFRMCATSGAACPGRLLPLCPPSPVPCAEAAPAPVPGASGPKAEARLHEPATTARSLVWSIDSYYQQADDRFRVAALLF